MKHWKKGILFLTLVALLACVLPACGGELGPEATVRAALKAWEAGDAEKAATYYVYVYEWELEAERDEIEGTDYSSFNNLETRLVSQTEYEATVAWELDFELVIRGESFSGRESDTWDLVKEDGIWLIDEDFHD